VGLNNYFELYIERDSPSNLTSVDLYEAIICVRLWYDRFNYRSYRNY